jgi:hypothetical protein
VTRSPRRFGAVAAPALAVALALVLAGCGTREAGAAAVVGGRRVSVADVQHAYQDIVAVVGPDQGVTQSDILNLLILEPYLVDAAAAEGRGVSPDDARLDLKAAGATDPGKLSAAALEVWRASLASTALQNDRPQAEIRTTYEGISRNLKSVGVHVNPRYGAGIDFSNLTIRPEQPNWLPTKPAATAAASGDGSTPAP